MSGADDADKQHEPTQKKLEDARKKGEVPRSSDLSTAAAYGGLLIALTTLGGQTVAKLGTTFSGMIAQSSSLAPDIFGNGLPAAGGLAMTVAGALAPWFALPAMAVLLAIFAQRSFTMAPEKLRPRVSRISPISNAKNKFGRNGLFEFAKSTAKLLIYSVVLGAFLAARLPEVLSTIYMTPAFASIVLTQLTTTFLFLVLAIAGAIGAIDYLWQVQEHLRKNRMSRREIKDEARQMESDPQVKQQRRQKGYELAMNQMLAEVPKADVIIVNPTHYAVALKWSRISGAAPECVAKGVDEIAARIREAGDENDVPIHSDPPTARALYASVEIGQEIHADHYRAVAAAIRFAEMIRANVRKKL